jgi:hypothetical protein
MGFGAMQILLAGVPAITKTDIVPVSAVVAICKEG